MKITKNDVLQPEFALNYAKYKKLNKKDKKDDAVLGKLVFCDYENWKEKFAIKFFLKNPEGLKFLSKSAQEKFLTKSNLKYMSVQVQLEAIEKDEDLLKLASDRVKTECFVLDPVRTTLYTDEEVCNIVLNSGIAYKVMRTLKQHIQLKVCMKNPKLLTFANEIVQDKIVTENPDWFKYASYDYKIVLADITTYNISKLTKDCIKRYIRLNQTYSKQKFEILIKAFYKNKKLRYLIEPLVKHTPAEFVSEENMDIYIKCHSNKKYRKIRRNKRWKNIKKSSLTK